jgi:hypothetical protein
VGNWSGEDLRGKQARDLRKGGRYLWRRVTRKVKKGKGGMESINNKWNGGEDEESKEGQEKARVWMTNGAEERNEDE